MAGTDELNLETTDFDGVDVLGVGGPYFGTGSPPDGDFYTEADLVSIADNTRALMASGELKAPLKLGHSVNQKLAQASGYEDGEMPALGWLDNPRVQDGKLKVDLKAVPKKLGALVRSGAFRTRSVELRGYVSQKTGEHLGPAIKGLALMGAKAPAVRTLDDVIALYHDDVDEEETQTREYGEVVWDPNLGYRWVQKSISNALNPEGEVRYYVADVGPQTALVTATSNSSTSGDTTITYTADGTNSWVVPFEISTSDEVMIGPADQWVRAASRWVDKANNFAEESGERVTALSADTSGKMGDTMETVDTEFEDAPAPEGEDEVEDEMVSVPKTEYEMLKSGAEAGARAERKLSEMERDTFFEEAARGGKVDPADMDDWKRRYDEQPEMVREIVISLKPQTVYLREFGSDSDGRDIENDAERDLGDAFDQYMGVRDEERVIGGRS